jgi:hypothetical protein
LTVLVTAEAIESAARANSTGKVYACRHLDERIGEGNCRRRPGRGSRLTSGGRVELSSWRTAQRHENRRSKDQTSGQSAHATSAFASLVPPFLPKFQSKGSIADGGGPHQNGPPVDPTPVDPTRIRSEKGASEVWRECSNAASRGTESAKCRAAAPKRG